MTKTPQSPECAAKMTFRRPTASRVCQRGSPNMIPAILQAARFTRRHDHAVEEEPEIDRPEATDEARGLAPNTGARRTPGPSALPTAARAARRRRPWRPPSGRTPTTTQFPATPLRLHDVRDEVGRVRAEGGRHHGQARKPPRNRAARGEELGRARRGAPGEEQGGNEADEERRRDDGPVECREVHRRVVYRRAVGCNPRQPQALMSGLQPAKATSKPRTTSRLQRRPWPRSSRWRATRGANSTVRRGIGSLQRQAAAGEPPLGRLRCGARTVSGPRSDRWPGPT